MARHTWTTKDEAWLRENYAQVSTRELAQHLGVSPTAIRQRAIALGVRKEVIWTAERKAQLVELYRSHSAMECAQLMGLGYKQVAYAAKRFALRKTRKWIAERCAANYAKSNNPGLRAAQFKKGQQPWNTGLHFVAGGRSAETRFKKGSRPHTWQPIGATRERKDGYLQRKVSDTGYTPRDYVSIHHLVWRMHGRGVVPKGYALCFIDGNNRNFDINNLELVARADLMKRNTVHRFGPEIASAYQLIGAIKRKTSKKLQEIAA